MVPVVCQRLALLLLPLFALGGCSSMQSQQGAGVPVIDGAGRQPPQPQEPVSGVPQSQSGPYVPPVVLPRSQSDMEQSLPGTSPAVVALLDNAEKERMAGRMDHAAAAIERAVGLEPQNALLWSRLAAIRLAQGNWQQASVLASRSNSLARNNRPVQLQNWRIIAQAKARMDDSAGASAARQMILRLGGND